MSRSLAGKVVVLTGASSELGRATALELARRGASRIAGRYAVKGLRRLAGA